MRLWLRLRMRIFQVSEPRRRMRRRGDFVADVFGFVDDFVETYVGVVRRIPTTMIPLVNKPGSKILLG